MRRCVRVVSQCNYIHNYNFCCNHIIILPVSIRLRVYIHHDHCGAVFRSESHVRFHGTLFIPSTPRIVIQVDGIRSSRMPSTWITIRSHLVVHSNYGSGFIIQHKLGIIVTADANDMTNELCHRMQSTSNMRSLHRMANIVPEVWVAFVPENT